MPQTPTRHPADSWPPTQLRLDPTAIEDTSALTYFLTPSHGTFDLSAGIETPSKKTTLLLAPQYDGRREEGQRASLPLLYEPSSDSDGEDYVRFPPGGLEIRRCPDETRKGPKGDKEKRSFSRNAASSSARNRGRAPRREEVQGGRGPQRAWREPSPYIWSANEERRGTGSGKRVGGRRGAVAMQEEPVDEKAVEERLRRRKVRFVLPAKE